jgi:hypothetical protein
MLDDYSESTPDEIEKCIEAGWRPVYFEIDKDEGFLIDLCYGCDLAKILHLQCENFPVNAIEIVAETMKGIWNKAADQCLLECGIPNREAAE